MSSKLNNLKLIIAIFIALGVSISLQSLLAWQTPTATPPNSNIAAPINTGSTAQDKSGSLSLGGNFLATGRATILGNESPTSISAMIQDGGTGDPGYFDLYRSGSIRVRLSPDISYFYTGNVGIGTTNPGANLHVVGTTRTDRLFFGTSDTSGVAGNYYSIYRESGSWVHPYPDMVIQYHTGIKYDAHQSYGGHRFYTGYDGTGNPTGLMFAVDNAVRAYGNLHVSGTAYANGQALCQANGVNCPAAGLGGSGTANYLSKFTAASTLGNSLVFDNGTNVGIGLTNPSQKLHVSGNIYSSNDIYLGTRSTWLSSWLNQSLMTDSGPTFANVYTNGWFRNNSAGSGLYNTATGKHFYSENTAYWAMNSTNGMILRSGHAGTPVGYLYWSGTAGSNNFGLLSPSGNWRVRVDNSNTELYGGAYMGTAYANILYDRDNTNYYLNPNGQSVLNTVQVAGTFYLGNTNLDANGNKLLDYAETAGNANTVGGYTASQLCKSDGTNCPTGVGGSEGLGEYQSIPVNYTGNYVSTDGFVVAQISVNNGTNCYFYVDSSSWPTKLVA